METVMLAPHPSLRACIGRYSFCAPAAAVLPPPRYLYATPAIKLYFFGQGSLMWTNSANRLWIKIPSNWFCSGALTRYTGRLIWNGAAPLFTIEFINNGFFRLLGMAGCSVTNQIKTQRFWNGPAMKELANAITRCAGAPAAAACADAWLLNLRKPIAMGHDSILDFCTRVQQRGSTESMEHLAHKVGVSLRQVERCFVQQLGLSPKMYCRLVRFENALALKQEQPRLSWMEVAHLCGYYDQMHLVKECRQFAGVTPSVIGSWPHLSHLQYPVAAV